MNNNVSSVDLTKLISKQKIQKAEKYDLVFREFDCMYELIGLVPDPNYNIEDFVGRKNLFPQRWLTLGVFSKEEIENV